MAVTLANRIRMVFHLGIEYQFFRVQEPVACPLTITNATRANMFGKSFSRSRQRQRRSARVVASRKHGVKSVVVPD